MILLKFNYEIKLLSRVQIESLRIANCKWFCFYYKRTIEIRHYANKHQYDRTY